MSRVRKVKIMLVVMACLVLAAVIGIPLTVLLGNRSDGTTSQTGSSSTAEQPAAKGSVQAPATAFDKKQYSLSDPASPWVIANKLRPLNPKTYAPRLATPTMKLRLAASQPEMQVSASMVADLNALAKSAQAAGLPMMLASGYRSYNTQVAVYGNEVRANGQAAADRQSARPGFSEHQTGLAVDLAPAAGNCVVEDCFGNTPEGKWLAAHAHEYGFVIRYQPGQEKVTGYRYEPWHIRYVGKALAAELYRQGNPVLETYFGLPAAANYAQ